MREFTLTIAKPFATGLRPDHRVGINVDTLRQMKGFKPSPYGAIVQDTLVYDNQPEIVWPFPQMFRGRSQTLIANVTEIYADSFENRLDIKDFTQPWNRASVRAGGAWHFIDLHAGWILLNGVSTIFNLGMNQGTIFEQHAVTIGTGCEHRGRVLYAGFDPENFWSSSWSSFWTAAATVHDVNDTTLDEGESFRDRVETALSIGSNFVWWSNIGGESVSMLFDYNSMINGPSGLSGYGTDRPYVYELMRRNDLGFMPMPFPGAIQCIKPFRRGVAVYGERGVAMLIPVSQPIPTMMLQEVNQSIGVASRGAVGGNQDLQIFIDQSGWLWSVNGEGAMQRVGYKEYLSQLSPEDTVITYNEVEEEFYICDGTLGFVLTKSGLAEMNQVVTSLNYTEPMQGIGTWVGDGYRYLTTDRFDLGLAGIKFISFVELGGVQLENVEGRVIATTQGKNSASDWMSAKAGAFYPGISGESFMVQLRTAEDSTSQTKIDVMNVKWKKPDNRFVRGLMPGGAA